jgi:hypothetical protein
MSTAEQQHIVEVPDLHQNIPLCTPECSSSEEGRSQLVMAQLPHSVLRIDALAP